MITGSSSVQIRTVSGSGIDIANKTKSRIESWGWMRAESRTEPWLESCVELKLEPRACSESEQCRDIIMRYTYLSRRDIYKIDCFGGRPAKIETLGNAGQCAAACERVKMSLKTP
ncbi:hypothetical protein EVAR_7468_1 [Eumeta japonica]|uniref:Uncharacterized protein n=1 Tax=Eumeta variegata TaxID=151549 RepID=A0A4C2A0J4_EUMVA|nr:hypothetical protein EVAR_7468_1 [Eumeta japonica]